MDHLLVEIVVRKMTSLRMLFQCERCVLDRLEVGEGEGGELTPETLVERHWELIENFAIRITKEMESAERFEESRMGV